MQQQPDLIATADGLLASSRLSLSFDPDELMADLGRLRMAARQRQPGSYHDGEWEGISLRSVGGRFTAGAGLPSLKLFRDTPLMFAAPAIERLLAQIPAPKLSTRILYLPPGAEIRSHVDDFTGFWHGILRLHVPIITNPLVTISIAGTRQTWEPGALWYGNFCLPHSVTNHGGTERAHLVVDVLITNELLDLFPPADRLRLNPAEITLAPQCTNGAGLGRLEIDAVGFKRSFALPAILIRQFMPALDAQLGAHGQDWLPAELARRGSRLVLSIAGLPMFRLEPINATMLRIANWSVGITLHLPQRGEGTGVLKLAMRMASPFVKPGRPLAPETLDLPLLN